MIKQEYIHEGTFEFEAGGSIEGLEIAYHTSAGIPDTIVILPYRNMEKRH